MLWRKIEKQIFDWIDNGKEAFLLSGARQTGKTFIIESCLKNRKCDYVAFNLIKQPEVIDAISSSIGKDVDSFVSKLSLLAKRPLNKGKTIIFFDEIQQYKEILTAIKFLVEEGSFRYVLSGSLLGVELVGIKSAPVGYLSSFQLFPLDFEEFLIAFKVQQSLIAGLRERFNKREPVDEVIHNKLLEIFYLYLVIGGMPAAVQKFIDSRDLMGVVAVHNMITEQYKVDFSKYERSQKLKLIETYNLIPAELNSKNKRYVFSDLNKDLRFERYEDSFMWFYNAGVAIPAFNTTEPVVPLEINKKNNLFKLFLSDVGMLSTCYGNATKLKLLNKGEDMNCGAIFENAVAQELHSHGFRLYYYNSKKLGETDFIIECDGKCVPIEVKSGKDYKIHSALDNVLSHKEFDISLAYVFSKGNIFQEGKILNLPIYMTMFVENTPLPQFLNVPDLAKLSF